MSTRRQQIANRAARNRARAFYQHRKPFYWDRPAEPETIKNEETNPSPLTHSDRYPHLRTAAAEPHPENHRELTALFRHYLEENANHTPAGGPDPTAARPR